jgi:PIN domain nuclease of toxin-antitoxin system
MTDGLLLDTHIVLWLDSGSDRLRTPTRAAIDRRWQAGETLYVSAVSVWEIALLVETGRIMLDLPVEPWFARFLGRPGIAAVALDHRAAAMAYRLAELEHRDPADRMLIATAIGLRCPLVTYDERIVRFADGHGARYGFSVCGTPSA